MKLAYLGYDKNIFKSYNFLAKYFQEIDSYLVNYDNCVQGSDLADLAIMTGNVYITQNIQLYTEKHKTALAQIDSEYSQLKKSIASVEPITVEPSHEAVLNKNYYRAKDILTLEFDRNSSKYFIETKHQGRFEYDYVVIQNHKSISDLFENKKQNVFKGVAGQAYVMLNLDFAIKAKLGKQVFEQEFIFVENPVIKSIFDNWYICKVDSDKITINFYIPYKQQDSEELIEFLIQRTRKIFDKEFITFELGEVLNKSILATNGFNNQSIKMKIKNLGSVFPSFSYWSEARVAGFIQNVFLNQNKKNRIFFSEKEKQ